MAGIGGVVRGSGITEVMEIAACVVAGYVLGW